MNLGSVQVHRPRIPQSFVAIAQPARICLKHLRTVSADDATTLWRVNSTSAISLISPSALTVGSPFQLGQRRRRLTDAMMPRCHDAMMPCMRCYDAMMPRWHDATILRCHRLSTGHGPQPPARREFRVRSPIGRNRTVWGGHPPVAHRGRRPGPQQPDGGPRNPARRPGFRRQLAPGAAHTARRPLCRAQAALTRARPHRAAPPP